MPTDAFGFWRLMGYITPIAYRWQQPGATSTDLVSVFRLTIEGTNDGKDSKLWLRWRFIGPSTLAVKNVTRASLWYPDQEASVWLPYEAPLIFQQISQPLEKQLEVMAVPRSRFKAFKPYQIRVEELIA